MTFEETVAMVFQPGMFEVFSLGLSLVFMCFFAFVVFAGLFDLIHALICRFIWPGKKLQDDKEAP